MSGHLSLVTLGVADVAVATRFYEALGFHKSSASQESVSFFQAGPVVLSVFGRESLADDAQVPSEGNGFRGMTIAMNLASREAVDSEFARWVAGGAIPMKAPQEVFWGGYSSYVADPDGYLWEIAHNPYMPVRADGSLDLPD